MSCVKSPSKFVGWLPDDKNLIRHITYRMAVNPSVDVFFPYRQIRLYKSYKTTSDSFSSVFRMSVAGCLWLGSKDNDPVGEWKWQPRWLRVTRTHARPHNIILFPFTFTPSWGCLPLVTDGRNPNRDNRSKRFITRPDGLVHRLAPYTNRTRCPFLYFCHSKSSRLNVLFLWKTRAVIFNQAVWHPCE